MRKQGCSRQKRCFWILVLFLFPGSVTPALSDQPVFSYLPILTEDTFYLLKAMGANGLVIDRWDAAPPFDRDFGSTSQRLSSLLRAYRCGKLGPPRRTRLQRNTSLSKTYYEISRPQPPLSQEELATKKLSDHLSAVNGVTLHNDDLYIANSQGVDRIPLHRFLDLVENRSILFELSDFQPLPFATGIIFLSAVFSNDLKLISTWNPSQSKSQINLYLDSDREPINQWEMETPILSLSIGEMSEDKSILRLFAAAGNTGIHVFEINLEESTFHPRFIHRSETLSPRELLRDLETSSNGITAVFPLEDEILFASNHHQTPILHSAPLHQMILLARQTHRQRMEDTITTNFQLRQTAKALWNGLVASIPFDADKLVDVIGFDLNGDLHKQLVENNVADSITPEEQAELEQFYSRFKLTGEFVGFSAQTYLIFKKIASIRREKLIRRTQQVETINELRRGLGINQTATGGLTPALPPIRKWLGLWRSEELMLAPQELTQFQSRIEALRLGTAGAIFSQEELLHIIRAMEARRSSLIPLERILSTQFSRLKLPASFGKLERWSMERLSAFFRSIPEEDLPKLFSPHVLTQWQRLKELGAAEELAQFQKIEQMVLTLKTKEGMLSALLKIQGPGGLSSQTQSALRRLEQHLGLGSELSELRQSTQELSQILARSDEAYCLERIVALNRTATLEDLEKLEKIRHLLKSGWMGNVGNAPLGGAPLRGSPLRGQMWGEALLAERRAQLIFEIDRIYDVEQMQRSGFISGMFRRGKLGETLLYTAYSDIANVATEWYSRRREGRPFLSEGLAHNLTFNTYIMFPIFASQGLRFSRRGKLFFLVLNATSTGYMTQKLTKYGHEFIDTRGDDPSPRMPITEMPGYVFRDMFINEDPHFNGGWALFDSGWTLFLSTPRGIGVSYLSNYLARLPRWQGNGLTDLVSRETARMAPVFLNETLGATTYTLTYGRLFDDRELQLRLIDARLDFIDPWQTESWERNPKLKLFLSVHSSTPPKAIRLTLSKRSLTSGALTPEIVSEETIDLSEELWEEKREQYYDLVWEREVEFGDEPCFYTIESLTLSNHDRRVSDNFRPWREWINEPGQTITLESPFVALSQKQEMFSQGLLKALLALSKEAHTIWLSGKHHIAAGIIYMIGQYLEPFYREGIIINRSHSLALDALKESIKITKSVNYSDTPIESEVILQLGRYLEKLAYRSLSTGEIIVGDLLENRDHQRRWLDFHTEKILAEIQEELLAETRSSWGIFDEGDKNDWHTLQLFRGYSAGLEKLYQWYRYHFQAPSDASHIAEILSILNDMKKSGHELEESWIAGLYWSDQYLIDFSQKIETLRKCFSK